MSDFGPGETATVHLSARSQAALEALAAQQGRPLEIVLGDLIDEQDSEAFFRKLNDEVAQLRADPEAWRQYQEESRLWHQLADAPEPE